MALKRIAIFFNGSLPNKDLVAAIDRSFVREMLPIVLDRERFDAVYRMDDECATKDAREDVVCLPPTLESLEKVVKDVNSKFVRQGDEVSVFTFVNGHGSESNMIPASAGWIDGRDFANVLVRLPQEVSRITNLHMCYAGGYAAFGLVDENDLLMAYSGGDEVNWSDASAIAILQRSIDPNKDGVTSIRENFWKGQSYVYNKLNPRRRKFVYMQGPKFIDRGLGTVAAKPPFPPNLVEVSNVALYLRISVMMDTCFGG